MESRASKPANLIYTPSQIVRAMAVFGLPFAPEATFAIAAILVVTGLALAFFGHGLWSTVMSLIGALLGSAVGFLFGAALGGQLAGGGPPARRRGRGGGPVPRVAGAP